MSIIDQIVEKLEAGALEAAKQVATEFVQEAGGDAVEFMTEAAPALKRYVQLAISKQISMDEFKHLIFGLGDLAKMHALTQAGLAAIQVEKTRNAILNAVSSIGMSAIGKLI